MKASLACMLLAAAILTGCSQSPQPAATVQNPAAATTSAHPATPAVTDTGALETPADPGCEFCAVPATVKRCEVSKGVRTTLFWDVTKKGVDKVVIYVVDKNGVDQHFGKGPAKGNKLTGPWLRPGIQFKIKDVSGNLLQVLTIDGVSC